MQGKEKKQRSSRSKKHKKRSERDDKKARRKERKRSTDKKKRQKRSRDKGGRSSSDEEDDGKPRKITHNEVCVCAQLSGCGICSVALCCCVRATMAGLMRTAHA